MKFSVIIPYYDKILDVYELTNLVHELTMSMRTAKGDSSDLEILVYHDGPEEKSTTFAMQDLLSDSFYNVKYKATNKRYNDSGHSLRDLGIKEAKGEYIIHMNPDNLIERSSFFLSLINKIEEDSPINNDIVVYSVNMQGMTCDGHHYYRTREVKDNVVLTGYPPVVNNIDCMQLVMKRKLWLAEGGWKDKAPNSDGPMYARFIKKYTARYIFKVIATHR